MYYVTQNKTVCLGKGNVKTCCKTELLVPKKFLGSITELQQWEFVFNPKNSPSEEGIDNIHPSPSNVNKSLRLVGQNGVIVGEVYEMLALSFKTVLLHINTTKRIQMEEFEKDKADPTSLMLLTMLLRFFN